jgi:hypothetical protein
LKLTSNGTDLGKTYYIKVVDNFDNFPASMNTPIYGKRSKSSDLWKLGGAARKFPVSGQIGVAGLFDV